MALPVYQSDQFATLSSSSSGDVTVTAPVSIASGDLLLAVCASDSANTATERWTTAESGWTKEGEAGNATTDCHIALFSKIATGSEPADYTFSCTVETSLDMVVWVIRITGADTTTPLHLGWVDNDNNATTDNLTITTGTTTINDCLCFAGAVYDGGDSNGLLWTGTGWVETAQRIVNTALTGVSAGWALLDQATAGAVQEPTVEAISNLVDGFEGFFIAIAPAAAASSDISAWNDVAYANISAVNEVTAANISALNEITF